MLCWKNKYIIIIIFKYIFGRNVHIFWPKRLSFLAESSMLFAETFMFFLAEMDPGRNVL